MATTPSGPQVRHRRANRAGRCDQKIGRRLHIASRALRLLFHCGIHRNPLREILANAHSHGDGITVPTTLPSRVEVKWLFVHSSTVRPGSVPSPHHTDTGP